MPTPSGLLKAGDELVNVDLPGKTFVVVSRAGNSTPYSVWIRSKTNEVLYRMKGSSGFHFMDRLSDDLRQVCMTIECDARTLRRYSGWSLKS